MICLSSHQIAGTLAQAAAAARTMNNGKENEACVSHLEMFSFKCASDSLFMLKFAA